MSNESASQQSEDNFKDELTSLINAHSEESRSNTPDFILAQYLRDFLNAFNGAVEASAEWHKD